jgi:hypothetical protein
MSQRSYLEERYSRKTRLQVVLMVLGFFVIFIGGVVAVQLSETPDESNARTESEFKRERSLDRKRLLDEQDNYIRAACEQSKKACDQAKADVQKQNCQLFSEGCPRESPTR